MSRNTVHALSSRMTYASRIKAMIDPKDQKRYYLEQKIKRVERNCTILARKLDQRSMSAFIDWSVKLYSLRAELKALG